MKDKTDKAEHKKRTEKRLRQIAINKRLWADPAKREQLVEGMRQAWKDPDVRQKRVAGMKRTWEQKKQQRILLLHQHG